MSEENIYNEQPMCEHCQTIKDDGMLHLKCFGNNKYQLCVENQKCYYRQNIITQAENKRLREALEKIEVETMTNIPALDSILNIRDIIKQSLGE